MYGINYGDYRTKTQLYFDCGAGAARKPRSSYLNFAHELKDIAAGNVSGSELEAVKS